MRKVFLFIGTMANCVVCIYAVMLACLNIIGMMVSPFLALFYVFLPMPFWLFGAFRELQDAMKQGEEVSGDWGVKVVVSTMIGFIGSIVLMGWFLSLGLAKAEPDASVYLTAGLPVSMFIMSGVLLFEMLRRRRLGRAGSSSAQ